MIKEFKKFLKGHLCLYLLVSTFRRPHSELILCIHCINLSKRFYSWSSESYEKFPPRMVRWFPFFSFLFRSINFTSSSIFYINETTWSKNPLGKSDVRWQKISSIEISSRQVYFSSIKKYKNAQLKCKDCPREKSYFRLKVILKTYSTFSETPHMPPA